MKNDKMKQQYRINEQIRVREVRIVGEEGSSVVPTRDALNMAREQGVDLVEISPNANPPVCRLIDYSKFLYQQKKRQKEMKAKQVLRPLYLPITSVRKKKNENKSRKILLIR